MSYDIIFCFSSFSLHYTIPHTTPFFNELDQMVVLLIRLYSLYSAKRARLLIIKWKYVFTAANNSWINNICASVCTHKALRLHKSGICSLSFRWRYFYYITFIFGKKSSTFYAMSATCTKAEILVCSPLTYLKWITPPVGNEAIFLHHCDFYFDENFMPWSSLIKYEPLYEIIYLAFFRLRSRMWW